jgi:large subunit ribosomal protein L7/L12
MATEKITQILDEIKTLTILEMKELVSALEEEFGVSAAPVAVAGAAAPAAAAGAEEKSEYDVVMTSFGEKKLDVIKVVREITGAGLKDAKDMVENVPSKIKEAVSKADGEEIVKKLTEAGATAELK